MPALLSVNFPPSLKMLSVSVSSSEFFVLFVFKYSVEEFPEYFFLSLLLFILAGPVFLLLLLNFPEVLVFCLCVNPPVYIVSFPLIVRFPIHAHMLSNLSPSFPLPHCLFIYRRTDLSACCALTNGGSCLFPLLLSYFYWLLSESCEYLWSGGFFFTMTQKKVLPTRPTSSTSR